MWPICSIFVATCLSSSDDTNYTKLYPQVHRAIHFRLPATSYLVYLVSLMFIKYQVVLI